MPPHTRGCGGTQEQERSWPSTISPPKQEGRQQSRSARGHQDTMLQGSGLWQEPKSPPQKAEGTQRCWRAPCRAGFTLSAAAAPHTCLFLPAQGLPPFADIQEESAALCFLQECPKRASQARGHACAGQSRALSMMQSDLCSTREPLSRALQKATITKTTPGDTQEGLRV